MTAKLRQHSLSSVRKLQELLHDCNVQLATFKNTVQQIGTPSDNQQLRREVETSAKSCIRACEATRNCILPQLKHEGHEFTRCATQFIGCLGACVAELKRCEALENTFQSSDTAPIASPYIQGLEEGLETLENLITVHFSTSESPPDMKVTPRRRRTGNCRPCGGQCMCSKLRTRVI